MSSSADSFTSLRESEPGRSLAAALGAFSAYFVGGTVRDALLGLPAGDLDLAFDADAEAVWAAIEPLGKLVRHERFGTATLELGEARVDLARTRSETYDRPGALPAVAAAPIEEDLRRRDFAANALALPLAAGTEPIDPFGGHADIESRQLRILHRRSFVDDPTRALRAARYCARLRFRLEQGTEEAIATADLATVSLDRAEAELARVADEPAAVEALALLDRWGVLAVGEARLGLAAAAAELLDLPPWREECARPAALRLAAWAPGEELEPVRALTAEPPPARPSVAVELAEGLSGPQLLVARAAGADWLDRYVGEWRGVRPEIGGEDLLAAGIAEGPAIGAALAATRAALLDGEIRPGRDSELAHAIAAAGSAG